MPFAKVNDITLYYEERGSGAPLLLIMGFGGNIRAWADAFLTPLAARFRVIVFDNRGAGQSDKPDVPYSIALMAEDTHGLLTHLGLDRAHVFGLSMGGMIAQELTLKHPGMVHGLVLGATNCGGPQSVLASNEVLRLLQVPEGLDPFAAARRGWPAIYSQRYLDTHWQTLEANLTYVLRYPTPLHARLRQLQAIQAWGSYDRLPEIRTPTLIVHGTADVLVPPRNAEILAERIPGARTHLITGAGHVLTTEAAAEVAQTIGAFLSALDA